MSLKPAYDHVFYRDDLEWNLCNILAEFYQNRGISGPEARSRAERHAFSLCVGDLGEEFFTDNDIKKSFKKK